MKVLFIGGTGNISMYITRDLLAAGHTVYLVNRGHKNADLEGDVHFITADIHTETDKIREAIQDMRFDVVANFIAYNAEDAERDVELFRGKTRQYMVLSTEVTNQKPAMQLPINETTPRRNVFSPYGRGKIAMEDVFNRAFTEEGFPVTIIRPGHTYGDAKVPVAIHGHKGAWPIMKRMLEGKPVIVPGDGFSYWTVTHSRDFSRGFIGLMGNRHAIGETVLLASEEILPWSEIHRIIADELGVELKLYPVSTWLLKDLCDYDLEADVLGDKAHSVMYDTSKLKKLVPGFNCTIRADQGVRRAVQLVLQDPSMQTEEPAFDEWCDRVIESLEEVKEKFRENRIF